MTSSAEYTAQLRRCQAKADQLEEEGRLAVLKLEELRDYSQAHIRLTDAMEQDLIYRRERLARPGFDISRSRIAQGYTEMMTALLAEGDRHLMNRWEQWRTFQGVITDHEAALAALYRRRDELEQEKQTLLSLREAARIEEAALDV